MNKRVQIHIRGRVQGVCFRMYAQEKAECLGLTGWIRNCDDGSVETLAEGEESLLKDFVEWHRLGPPHACVNSVNVHYSNATGEFRSFNVIG